MKCAARKPRKPTKRASLRRARHEAQMKLMYPPPIPGEEPLGPFKAAVRALAQILSCRRRKPCAVPASELADNLADHAEFFAVLGPRWDAFVHAVQVRREALAKHFEEIRNRAKLAAAGTKRLPKPRFAGIGDPQEDE